MTRRCFPGADIRWLTVAPKGCPTELTLFPMGGQWEHYREAMGKPQCFTLHCDDIMETYRELTAKGVQIPGRAAGAELGQLRHAGRFRGQPNRVGAAGVGLRRVSPEARQENASITGDPMGSPYD